VLRYPLSRPVVKEITPPFASTRDELTVVRSLFDGLVDIDPATGRLSPAIARNWSASRDLRSFSFVLRADARFSNGVGVSAGTFVDDWNFLCRVNGSAAALLSVVEGGEGCGTGSWTGPLSGVTAPSPGRLEVRLSRPFADFPSMVANPGLWAFPAAIAQEEYAGGHPQVVGSGPFRVAEQTPDHILLERNPRAIRRAHLDGVDFALLPGGDAQRAGLAGYRQGTYDVAEVPARQAQVTMADPVLSRQMLVQPIAATTLVVLKPSQRLGLDQRQALGWTTDAHTVAASVTGGVSTVADGLIPPVMPEYTPGASPYSFDRGQARRLLAGRGLHGVTVGAVRDLRFPGLVDTGRIAGTLVAGYHRAGIPVAEVRGRRASAVVVRLDAEYPSVDAILSQLVPGGDLEALAPARSTADREKRADLYRELADRLLGQATVIPVTFDGRAFVVSPRVSHFQIDSLGLPHLASCWMTAEAAAG
jgi:ABC-type transport system substrate-binding protein